MLSLQERRTSFLGSNGGFVEIAEEAGAWGFPYPNDLRGEVGGGIAGMRFWRFTSLYAVGRWNLMNYLNVFRFGSVNRNNE